MRSITIERHEWRGFSYESTLLELALIAGWVTVLITPYSLMDKLREAKEALQRLAEVRK